MFATTITIWSRDHIHNGRANEDTANTWAQSANMCSDQDVTWTGLNDDSKHRYQCTRGR